MEPGTDPLSLSPEQARYAKVLEIGVRIGLLLLVVTFSLYIFGVLKPAVPVQELPEYWSLSAADFGHAIDENFVHGDHNLRGWGWVTAVGHGDYLPFVGITLLAGVTIVCYMAILPILLRRGDRLYAAIAVAEILILALAASGILTTGGH